MALKGRIQPTLATQRTTAVGASRRLAPVTAKVASAFDLPTFVIVHTDR